MTWKTCMTALALSGALVACNAPPPCVAMPLEIPANGIDDDCNGSVDDAEEQVIRTYVVSTIDIQLPTDESSYGFDLDGADGRVGDAACTGAQDYVSAVTGEAGVDNQLGRSSMMDEGASNGAFQEQIQDGGLLLVFQVSEINSFTNDDSVVVHIALGAFDGVPVADGAGLAADQTFTEAMDLGTVEGVITAGRLRAETGMLPLSYAVDGSVVTLALRNVVIGGTITETGGLMDGELGGVVLVDDVVTIVDIFIDGITRDMIELLTMPDMQPVGDGTTCDAISAGLGFQAVRAMLE